MDNFIWSQSIYNTQAPLYAKNEEDTDYLAPINPSILLGFRAMILIFVIELPTAIQENLSTSLPVTEAVLESSVASPQNSSLLISSSKKSDSEG